MIEGNCGSINKEFQALKRRVVTQGNNFKANYLAYKGIAKKSDQLPYIKEEQMPKINYQKANYSNLSRMKPNQRCSN